MAAHNSLIKTLRSLRGNPRACVYTEPLWGLSMNLCFPYASVYMLALGLNDSQIGLIASMYMLSQVIFAFLGGPITDKMGRRKATAVFDFIAWSVPCIIWNRAEGFWFFFAAALLSGTMKVTTNSWDCLLIEDAEKSKITGIYSLVIICGQFSAIFAPISAILFSRLTLVPAIRILYLNAFVVMTAKILILYAISKETKTGMIRMAETRGKSLFSLVAGYGGVLKIIARSRGTIFSLAITLAVGIVAMINTTFWQVIVTQKLLVRDALLPLFLVLKSVVAIVFLTFVVPRLTRGFLRLPLLTGFACYFVGQTLLLLVPVSGPAKYAALCVSLVFDGFGAGSLAMLAESLVALNVNPAERARIMAIQHMIIMALSAPFGWIAGLLSDISRNLPFVLSLCILVAGFCFTIAYYLKDPRPASEIHAEAPAETSAEV